MISQPSMCPDECPTSPDKQPCSVMPIQTGAAHIPVIRQCTRCGWVDPAALDGAAYSAYTALLSGFEQRVSMATGVEPFAFVVQTGVPLTLGEGITQALAAASMAWDEEPAGKLRTERCEQIARELWRLVQEEVRQRASASTA